MSVEGMSCGPAICPRIAFDSIVRFWLQFAVLAIVILGLIAIAAKYVW